MTRYYDALYDTAEYACDLAFANASNDLKTLKGGRSSFYPVVDEESDQIGIGINTNYHYLIYQNNGFASFPMSWAVGRVVPMLINGKVVYRKCRGVGYEQPWMQPNHKNYWQRGIDGDLIPEYSPKLGWVHPGMPPKNFIDDAIEQAIEDNIDEIDAAKVQDKFGFIGGSLINGLKNLAKKIRGWF